MSLKDFTDFFSTNIFFFIFFGKWLFAMLHNAYVVLWAANHFVGSGTPKHYALDLSMKILKIQIPSHTFYMKHTTSYFWRTQ